MLERRGAFSASGPWKVLESFLRRCVAAHLHCIKLWGVDLFYLLRIEHLASTDGFAFCRLCILDQVWKPVNLLRRHNKVFC